MAISSYIRNTLSNKKPVSTSIGKTLFAHGVFTGSKIFGGFNGQLSDIDIILPPNFRYSFDSLVMENGAYESDYSQLEFRSLYIKHPTSKYIINLLFFNTELDYKKWVVATEKLVRIIKNDPEIATSMKIKDNRVVLFEALKYVIENETDRLKGNQETRGRPKKRPLLFTPMDDDYPPF